MKTCLVIFLVVVCAAIVSADDSPSKQSRRRRGCRNDDDCSENECCVKVSFPFWGKCRRLGRRGDRCLPRDVVDSLHQARCPCQEGLECTPRRIKQTPIGEIPFNFRCVRGNSTMTTEGVTDEVATTESIVDEDEQVTDEVITDESIVDDDEQVTDEVITDETADDEDEGESESVETESEE